MSEFAEADARLGAMHGYVQLDPLAPEEALATLGDVMRLEAKVDALETLVRALTVALRGGAVGKWS